MLEFIAVLNYAIAGFVLLIGIEFLVSRFKKQSIAHSMDTISSLSSGVTNIIKQVFRLTAIIISYEFMVEHISIFKVQTTWVAYVIAFIAFDFAGYWIHRLNHKVNYFWNHHIIHHSSEEFNLPCALRQSISNFFAIGTILLFPAAIFGVEPIVIATIAPIHLFAQFWYHTRLINRMGFLEKVLVTPSHHRVHHAINERYLDKNLSQIFILWDKLFGTFQEELDEDPPVYGVSRPVGTWNPIKINFIHLWLLIKDAWRTSSFAEKILIWFKPTGWRPDGFDEKYPVNKITDVFNFEKYNPPASIYLKGWSWVQLIITLAMVLHCFNDITNIGLELGLIYGLFIVYSIYTYSTLMDQLNRAIIFEFARFIMAASVFFVFGDWFSISKFGVEWTYITAGYFLASLLCTFYFVFFEFKKKPLQISSLA